MKRQTENPADDYAEIAEFYDLEHDQFQDDIGMYRNVVEMVGDPVVEFACGSGRILAGLARPGRRMTGVDTSNVMLDRCRARFANAGDPPILIQQDMATIELPPGQAGVVIIGLNSLMHSSGSDSQLNTLASAHRALDPRGLLVIDLFNPLLAIHDTGDGRVRLEGTFQNARGESVSKFSSQEVDLAAQVIQTQIWYDAFASGSPVIRHQTSTSLRFLFRSELEYMLRAAGFPSMHFYGTYDLDEYSSQTPRLIVFAERS